MPFVKDGRTLIAQAFAEKFAMPSFNICGLEMAKACIEAAEEERAPIMIQTGPDDLMHSSPAVYGAMIRALAEEATVPVMLHLDHGDSLERVTACLRAGYSSVMFDGEHYSLDENVACTKALADFAHASGAALEAAAGSFGGEGEGHHAEVHLTDPEVAERLITEAGADMVACSVGSVHGQSSKLDLTRLKTIQKRIKAPIVIHGGTGVPAEDLAAAVKLGVVKLNIGAGLVRAMLGTWRNKSSKAKWHYDIYRLSRDAAREVAREKIRFTKAAGRA
jgi:fructose-bisphosphate aldolase class II